MLPMLLLTDDPSRDGTSQSLSSIDAEADLEECRSVMAAFGEEDSAPLEDVAVSTNRFGGLLALEDAAPPPPLEEQHVCLQAKVICVPPDDRLPDAVKDWEDQFSEAVLRCSSDLWRREVASPLGRLLV
eukprot:11421184-Prorocentrum_lima.AAC.1